MSTARPFFDTAREVRKGQFLEDCADALHEAVAATEDTGKAAKVVIELTIKPATKGKGTVVIADKVRTKLPELPVGETIMFVTPENNLVPNDPRQQKLDLKDVSANGAAELKTING